MDRRVVASLESYCSRPHAPTRRLALGRRTLPVDPAPGLGGVLLGGVVARFAPELDADDRSELGHLALELQRGHRIAQPRLRHRLQNDRIGLDPIAHRLVDRGGELCFEFDDRGAPAQHALAAVYAAGHLEPPARRAVFGTIDRALAWHGRIGPELIAALAGSGGAVATLQSISDPRTWALQRLGFATGGVGPSAREVQRRYRERLRDVHPDHGAVVDGAAERIAELTEARRVLIGR